MKTTKNIRNRMITLGMAAVIAMSAISIPQAVSAEDMADAQAEAVTAMEGFEVRKDNAGETETPEAVESDGAIRNIRDTESILDITSDMRMDTASEDSETSETTAKQPKKTCKINGVTYALNEDGKSYYVKGTYVEALEHVVLESEIDGFPVTGIGKGALAGYYVQKTIKSVVIPEGITYIEDGAFCRCINLENIIIPESVTDIGEYILSGCTSLQSVTILGKLKSLKEETFYGCYNLESVVLPDSITEFEYGAFMACYNLKNIALPSSLVTIGNNAFDTCKNLQNIIIPEGVTSIGSGAFVDCIGLKSIMLPSSLKDIEMGAFYNCSNLLSVTIPAGVTSIGDAAFKDCSSLVNVTIPEGVKSIGEHSFAGCTSLTSVSIPSSVKTVDVSAFPDTMHTVVFQSNGGKKLDVSSVMVNDGKKIGTLPAAKRSGYALKGWYTAKSGGKKVTAKTVVKEDLKLYARWEKVKKPGKVSIQNLSSKKSKRITIKCAKVKNVDGYQIVYSTTKKFTKKTTQKVTVASKSCTLKKLTSGKEYFVKVRAYRIDSAGKKHYGKYSAVRRVTVK